MKFLLSLIILISGVNLQAQKIFRSATSTSTANPLVYDKTASDTAINGAVSRAIKAYAAIQAQIDLKQDQADAANIKSFKDSIKMLRDSINLLRPVVFADGFTVARGPLTDTIKNTASLNLKDVNLRIDTTNNSIGALKGLYLGSTKSLSDRIVLDSSSLVAYKTNIEGRLVPVEDWKKSVIQVLLDFVDKLEAMRKSIPNGLQYPIN